MLKEVIKYEDFDGTDREDTFWFNLTKAEILELEFQYNGDLSRRIKQLGEAEDGARVMELFKAIMAKAYGVRKEDGGFDKSPGLFERFATTEAYSELIMSFLTDPNKMAHFVAGLVSGKKRLTPEEVQVEIDKRFEAQGISKQSVFARQPEEAAPPFQAPPTSTGPRPPVRPTQQG